MTTATRRTYEELALLPLPKAVLFPHTTLPLHIFEPRHRALAQRTLSRKSLIALATIDGNLDATHQGPAVHEVLALARISEYESLEDGRFLLFLEGTGRARMLQELNVDTAYRQVDVVRLDDHLAPSARRQADDLVESIRGSLVTLDQRGVDGAAMLNYQAGQGRSPGAVADTVAASIFPKMSQRRGLLEELDVIRRLRAVDHRLDTLIAEAHQINPLERSELN